MNHDLGFLHTAAVHRQNFDALIKKLAPQLTVHHEVDEGLLEKARKLGLTPSVQSDISAAMQRAASSGAKLVVCTCSTIGGVAETLGGHASFSTMRIDRAMADQAAAKDGRILIAAALESTLMPTRGLLEESINRQNRHSKLNTLHIADAWSHFENADLEEYFSCIHEALSKVWQNYDVIVLAQASMAGAALLCDEIDIPVLSSPETGVKAAIFELERLKNSHE